MAVLNSTYTTYLGQITDKMTDVTSPYQKLLTGITAEFDAYGLTPEQKAEYTVQAYLGALQTITTNANQATIEVIKEEKAQDLIDKQILKLTSEIALVDGQTLKIAEDLKLVTQQISKLVKDELLVDEQIKSEVKNNQLNGMIDKQILKLVADIALVDETTLTQTQATAKTLNEALRVVRDTTGYSDQIHMKMVAEQASLASFAVNADSTDAQTAITKLTTMIDNALLRAT